MSTLKCSIKTFKPQYGSESGGGGGGSELLFHDLIAVMGKEMACEGFPGIAWVNWATGVPATSVVYMSIISDTGPWVEVYNDSTLVYDHQVMVPILAIDTQHWFYVVSVSDQKGTETSDVYTFCTAGEVIISVDGALSASAVLEIVPVVSLAQVSLYSTAGYSGTGTAGPAPDGPGGGASLEILTLVEVSEIADEIGAGYAGHSVV